MNRSTRWPNRAFISRVVAGISRVVAGISRVVAGVSMLLLLPLLVGSISIEAAEAQETPEEVVVFVLDLSGSMNEPFDASQSKLDAAKAAFVEAFANVSPDALVGLRTYGDQIEPTSPENREVSCSTDTRLLTPVGPLQRSALIGQVQGFTALGDTPMGLALEAASTDIPDGASGTIVLFSDGRDECFDADLDGDPSTGPSFGGDPCEIAKAIVNGSNVDRVMTVGFATDDAAEAELRCIAESTGGAYTTIQTPEDARDVLPELLVSLSAPREAQRLVGRDIAGTPKSEDAPDMERLNVVGVDQILYTDTIKMNSQRYYRVPEFGPGRGTLTATVFGLPAESGITFDLRMVVPRLEKSFFEGEHGDTDAGLPQQSSTSIRCTGCEIDGDRSNEVFWVISLRSTDDKATGTYELELLTEGPGFGGPTTSCRAPQACFYPAEIAAAEAELAELQSQIATAGTDVAPPELIAERDAIEAEATAAQDAVSRATLRAEDLEARIANAPIQPNSWRLPILLMFLGGLLAFAPVHKVLNRSKDDDDDADDDVDPASPEAPTPVSEAAPAAAASAQAGPSLDIGPTPAVSPERGPGHDWDAELEAAKAALAEQRPVHPRNLPKEEEKVPATSATDMMARKAEMALAEEAAAAAEGAAAPIALGDSASAPSSGEAFALEAPEVPPAVAAASAVAGQAPPAVPTPATPSSAEQAAAQQQAAEQQAAAQQAAAQQAAAQQQAAAAEPAQSLPAGWYQDPADPTQYRWWDGEAWTEHTNKGEQ